MNLFFRASSEDYESIRISMDEKSNFTNGQSWFVPALESPKDSSGFCLIAAIPAISDEFISRGIQDITFEEYASAFPSSIS